MQTFKNKVFDVLFNSEDYKFSKEVCDAIGCSDDEITRVNMVVNELNLIEGCNIDVKDYRGKFSYKLTTTKTYCQLVDKGIPATIIDILSETEDHMSIEDMHVKYLLGDGVRVDFKRFRMAFRRLTKYNQIAFDIYKQDGKEMFFMTSPPVRPYTSVQNKRAKESVKKRKAKVSAAHFNDRHSPIDLLFMGEINKAAMKNKSINNARL